MLQRVGEAPTYLDDGVLVMRVSGLLTCARAVALITEVRRAAWKAGERGILIDARGAAVAVSREQFDQVVGGNAKAFARRPVAYVSSEACLEVWQNHVWRMDQAGLERAAFVSMERAREWLARSMSAHSGADQGRRPNFCS